MRERGRDERRERWEKQAGRERERKGERYRGMEREKESLLEDT